MQNVTVGPKLKKDKFYAFKQAITPYLFLAPALILIGIFLIYPLLYTGFLSFQNYNPLNGNMSFTFDNYKTLFVDEEFRKVLINTVIFIVGTIPVTVVLSLYLAVMLNKNMKFKGILRTIFFLPNVTSFAAAGVVFIWMLDGDAEKGLINHVLGWLGIGPVNWLQIGTGAMFAVMALTVWKNIGYFMVIYIAGLQDIPTTVYEASQIDGAGTFRTFKDITLPLLKPTTIFVVMIDIIFTLRTFEQIYVMTKGGPALSTKVLVYYIYEQAFGGTFNMGYAAAVSMVLLLLVFILVAVQNLLLKNEADTVTE